MSLNSSQPHRHPACPRATLLATLALGITARIAQYLSNYSLWRDEAHLARNILERYFSGLMRPLDHLPIASPLFLWAVQLAVLLWGDGQWVLRRVPLIGGILMLLFGLAGPLRCRWAGHPTAISPYAAIFLYDLRSSGDRSG